VPSDPSVNTPACEPVVVVVRSRTDGQTATPRTLHTHSLTQTARARVCVCVNVRVCFGAAAAPMKTVPPDASLRADSSTS
jgi:hypothetical protein